MTPQNYRPTEAVKLGMVSTAPEQGRARPSREEDRVAREAGGPLGRIGVTTRGRSRGPQLGSAGGRRGLLLGRMRGVPQQQGGLGQ